jgi:hypothetical protein
MKTWLGAAGRLCADCLLVLILLVLAALGGKPGSLSPAFILEKAAQAALGLLPLAAAASVFLGLFTFESHLGRKYRLVSWLSVLVLGFGILVGGSALRRLDLGLGFAPSPETSLPASGVILDRGDEGLWASSFDQGGATRVLGFRAGAGLLEGIVYAPRAEHGKKDQELSLAGRAWSLAPPAEVHKNGRMKMDLGILDARTSAIDGLPFPLALAALGGFALLAAGLAGLSQLPRWPLVGFFFAIGGFLGLLVLDSALGGPETGYLLASLGPRLGLGSVPQALLVAGIEAFLGLVLGALTLPSWGREES